MELKKVMSRRKDLTLLYICDRIYFSKENTYKKSHINKENLLLSKIQLKLTGKLCILGKTEDNIACTFFSALITGTVSKTAMMSHRYFFT